MKDIHYLIIMLLIGGFGLFYFSGKRYRSDIEDKNRMGHAISGFWGAIFIIILSIIAMIRKIME